MSSISFYRGIPEQKLIAFVFLMNYQPHPIFLKYCLHLPSPALLTSPFLTKVGSSHHLFLNSRNYCYNWPNLKRVAMVLSHPEKVRIVKTILPYSHVVMSSCILHRSSGLILISSQNTYLKCFSHAIFPSLALSHHAHFHRSTSVSLACNFIS